MEYLHLVAGLLGLILYFANTGRAGRIRRASAAAFDRLLNRLPPEPLWFSEAMLAELPELARRYFSFALPLNSYLPSRCELEMQGRVAMGGPRWPRFQRLKAREIFALPQDLSWSAQIGPLWRGYDICEAERQLSAFLCLQTPDMSLPRQLLLMARSLADLLWMPASLLPRFGAHWEALDSNSALISKRLGGQELKMRLQMASDGYPLSLVVVEADEAVPLEHAIGIEVRGVEAFGDFRLPARIAGIAGFESPYRFEFLELQLSRAHYR